MVGWAVADWHTVQARAVTCGLIGRPGAPTRLVDVDTTLLLAFIEAVVCETEAGAKQMQQMWDDARPRPAPEEPARGPARAAEIDHILNL